MRAVPEQLRELEGRAAEVAMRSSQGLNTCGGPPVLGLDRDPGSAQPARQSVYSPGNSAFYSQDAIGDAGICSRVLVVEDDPDFLTVVGDALHLAGVEVTHGAHSVSEAEEALSAGFRPSVVVLDLHLEERRGETLLTKLRADPEYANVKVIACSGDWVALSRIRHSVDCILLKPVGPSGLLRALHEVCERSQG